MGRQLGGQNWEAATAMAFQPIGRTVICLATPCFAQHPHFPSHPPTFPRLSQSVQAAADTDQ